MNPLDLELAHRFRGRRVAVLYGGDSAEREVSLATGTAIADALGSLDYEVERFDWSASRAGELADRGLDAAFIALHGGGGENGQVQGFLELLGVPYTGSGVLASALCMDKVRTKSLAVTAGLPTAPWAVLTRAQAREALVSAEVGCPLELPVVVKPSADGSSVGITMLRTPEVSFSTALEAALGGRGDVLVERFVPGREVSVAVFGGQAIGSCAIVPADDAGFYSYEAKYRRRDTTYRVPPDLAPDVIASFESMAETLYRAMGCRGVARIDFIVEDERSPWLLEVNTVPGMTQTSLVPKIAAARGVDFPQLCAWLLDLASLDGGLE